MMAIDIGAGPADFPQSFSRFNPHFGCQNQRRDGSIASFENRHWLPSI
jgi:hypothetical protein